MALKRREVLLGLASASLPIILASCGGEKTEETTNTTSTENASPAANNTGKVPEKIRIGYQVIPNPELLAKAEGLAAKAFPNSKIEYISFDSGRDVNTAIAANGIDFGVLGSVPASVGIAQGLQYQVYFIQDVIGAAEALITKKGIKTLADLKGKKVATPFGSTAHFSLEALLEQEGIPEKDLKILDLQPPDIVAAWSRGDIDASYVWQPTLGKLQKTGGTILVTSADLAKKGIVTADLGVVRTEFANQYPDVVKQYVGVLDEAVKAYRTDPKAATTALAKELNITPAETESSVKELVWLDSTEQKEPKYLGSTDQPGELAKILKNQADFAVTQKKITSAPDLAVYQQNLYTKAL
jgi:taurine transport system substrate-binding protein